MPPFFQAAAPPAGGGTHVLLIGVNHYTELPAEDGTGGGGNGDRHAPGLKRLSTSVPSIERLANWFIDGASGNKGFSSARFPLASLDILLSPGQFTRSDGTTTAVPEATFRNIRTAAHEWRTRAHGHQENRAMLFFVGHGMEGTDHYLLPSDAFSDANAPGENLIKLNTLITRMGSCRAGIQMFFVDACRSHLGAQLQSQEEAGEDFCAPFLSPQPSLHPRHVPLYRAALAKGQPALGRTGMHTFFTEGLLDCFNHHGASDNGGAGAFQVTADSLRAALDERMKRMTAEKSLPLNCDCKDMSQTMPAIPLDLHEIPAADCRVLARVSTVPAEVFPTTFFSIAGNGITQAHPPTGGPPPPPTLTTWDTDLPPGEYDLSTFSNPGQLIATRRKEFRMPVDHCKLPVP
ncbi:caspase family protein [Luteolibacter soli]|uniref:Caspase family protein n=1 Tax=Luteolibacter soli TaxID=3135280 RepID=A0ABU9AXH5_9BACT